MSECTYARNNWVGVRFPTVWTAPATEKTDTKKNRPGLGRKRASRAASDSETGVDTAGSQQSRPLRSFNLLRLSWLAEAIVDRS